MRQYTRAANSAMTIAAWLHNEGWEARASDRAYGQHSYHDTCCYCSRLWRIRKARFNHQPRIWIIIQVICCSNRRAHCLFQNHNSHGVDDFCTACRVCEDACPPFAILPEKKKVRGIKKWYVDFDRCLPFFQSTSRLWYLHCSLPLVSCQVWD